MIAAGRPRFEKAVAALAQDDGRAGRAEPRAAARAGVASAEDGLGEEMRYGPVCSRGARERRASADREQGRGALARLERAAIGPARAVVAVSDARQRAAAPSKRRRNASMPATRDSMIGGSGVSIRRVRDAHDLKIEVEDEAVVPDACSRLTPSAVTCRSISTRGRRRARRSTAASGRSGEHRRQRAPERRGLADQVVRAIGVDREVAAKEVVVLGQRSRAMRRSDDRAGSRRRARRAASRATRSRGRPLRDARPIDAASRPGSA